MHSSVATLEAVIQDAFPCHCPLVYPGCTFYGCSPYAADSDEEVLLGSGAVVFLDPPWPLPEEGAGTRVVGVYELLLYRSKDLSGGGPVERFHIGPYTAARRMQDCSDVCCFDALDRESDGCAAMCKLVVARETLPYTLVFKEEDVCVSFWRELELRRRVMELALRTVRQGHEAQSVHQKLEKNSFRRICSKFICCITMTRLLLLVVVSMWLAVLWSKDPWGPKVLYTNRLAQDAHTAFNIFRGEAMTILSKMCEVTFGTVPGADVRRCIIHTSELKFWHCMSSLIGPL